MNNEIVTLDENHNSSPLYSEDLAPVPIVKRTWSKWHLAALWVGMAVCVPTYILASYMIGAGMSWIESLIIIGVANLIITIPMVLNGHAGVKYGIPFPVVGRVAFGTRGIHIPSVVRALVACGWFGVNTWLGGVAIYAIYHALAGTSGVDGLTIGKFIGFGLFWILNMYFIWKGTESIKFLEQYSAPILIFMGFILISWGAYQAGGLKKVLDQSARLQTPTAVRDGGYVTLNVLKDKNGNPKADDYSLSINGRSAEWLPIAGPVLTPLSVGNDKIQFQFRKKMNGEWIVTEKINPVSAKSTKRTWKNKLRNYFFWLNVMLGFWATMSLSIADITRYAATQRDQVIGQFVGLPGTMMLYSFVGIFVTTAAVINFEDILIISEAPWDPISLLAKFDNPWVVVVSQCFMIIATLSTNIAANVIAPANAISNLSPRQISFRTGGVITGIIGILICPWLLLNQISGLLIFVSGLLGPVLGIMLADYFIIRRRVLHLDEIYKVGGLYSYKNGFNPSAIIALSAGVFIAVVGHYWSPLELLYTLSWFTGFTVSFILYYLLMSKK